jgi:hypothetical protein
MLLPSSGLTISRITYKTVSLTYGQAEHSLRNTTPDIKVEVKLWIITGDGLQTSTGDSDRGDCNRGWAQALSALHVWSGTHSHAVSDVCFVRLQIHYFITVSCFPTSHNYTLEQWQRNASNCVCILTVNTKKCVLSVRANYTDRATDACRRR